MSDITLTFDAANLRGDFVLGPFDLVTGNDLESSIIMSLFTLPSWWADIYEPDNIGCRLLTVLRAKHTDDTRLKARDFCRKALAWLIEDRVAQAVDVQTQWQGDALLIAILVTQATGVTRYSYVWKGVA